MTGTVQITPTNTFASQSGSIPLSQLDTNFTQITSFLNNPNNYANYLVDSGTANTYVVTFPTGVIPASYTAGLSVVMKVTNSNTGASTVNVNGLGAKSILNPDGSALTNNQMTATSVVALVYDGTQFLLAGGGAIAPTSNYTGFKNRIINGAMSLDQRNAGASQTITAAAALAYTVDRWYAYCTGANVTGQQIAGAYTSSQYRYQFTGAASVTAIGFGQRIEAKNCFDLANTTATLSCYISNSLLTTVTWTAYYATTTADTFGSLASPTVTQIATGTFTVSSTRTQYTTNISIPSAATTGIQILFTVGAQTSGTWIIDSVQLEKGSTATSFDYRPYGTELALCQRYYAKTFPIGTAPGNDITTSGALRGTAVTINASSQIEPAAIWKFPVSMRTTPTTVTMYAPGTSGHTAGQWTNDGNAGSSANARTNFAGTESALFDNTAVLLTAGWRPIIHATADAEL